MHHRTARLGLFPSLSLGALMVFASCTPATTDSTAFTDEDLAAVQAAWDAIAAADAAADWDAVAAYLTDDFVHMDPRRPIIRGLAEWREWTEAMEIGPGGLSFEVEEIEGSGDLAYLVWTFSGSWTEAGEQMEAEGKGLSIFRRQADGSWKSSRNAWNADS
jgi:ketosteroid isomerase-like protein